MNDYERALALQEETIAHRRYLHTNAEVGLVMPKAKAYVMEKLAECGITPQECGHGVTATIGHGGKCILQLRGVRPFLSDKYDITKHPNYYLTADADDRNTFDMEKFLNLKLKLQSNEEYDIIRV